MGKISSEKKVFSEYPSNLKVLAIDTDPIVLEFIKKVCNEYCYEVITCTESLSAAIILQEKKSTIDLILMEVHMPNMDGYEFLLTTQEINVPKLMMSFDDSKKSVMKTIKLGACDYMIKPLHEDRLRNMWTHVVRKSMNEDKMRKNIRNSLEDDNQNSRFVFSSSDEISREVGNAGKSKKPRVVWTTDLHGKFVKAVNQLGLENAVPNKIQQLMDTPYLTRNHVASHLQKYRNVLKEKARREKERQPEPKREQQSVPDIQMDNHHAEEAFGFALSDPVAIYPTIAIPQNFPQTLDSECGIWSPYNAILAENEAMLQRNTVSLDSLQQQQQLQQNMQQHQQQLQQNMQQHPQQNMQQHQQQNIQQHQQQNMQSSVLKQLQQKLLEQLQQQLQQQNMQSSVMQNQVPLINFQPSSVIISENPYLVTQNDNFGRNIDQRSIQ